MSAVWPGTLPQFQSGDVKEARDPQYVSFQCANGPEIRRRVTAHAPKTQTFLLQFSGAELAIFRTFYDDTLAGGTLPFEWEDAVTDETVEMRFVSEPQFELTVAAPLPDDRQYQATATVEVL